MFDCLYRFLPIVWLLGYVEDHPCWGNSNRTSEFDRIFLLKILILSTWVISFIKHLTFVFLSNVRLLTHLIRVAIIFLSSVSIFIHYVTPECWVIPFIMLPLKRKVLFLIHVHLHFHHRWFSFNETCVWTLLVRKTFKTRSRSNSYHRLRYLC